MANTRERAELLADVPLFSRCTKRDLRIVARHLEVMTVPTGTEIVRQGDDGEAFYVLLDGELIVEQDGRRTATLTVGDAFGELALLDPAPRSATVTADGDAEVGALSVRMFRVVLRDLPQVAAGMLASLAGQLREERAST